MRQKRLKKTLACLLRVSIKGMKLMTHKLFEISLTLQRNKTGNIPYFELLELERIKIAEAMLKIERI